MYFSFPFFTRPRVPSATGIFVVFMPHITSFSISRSLYFESFSVVFIDVFLSVGTDISISWQVLCFLSFTTMSGPLALISLSVWIGMFHSIVTLLLSDTVLVHVHNICQSL